MVQGFEVYSRFESGADRKGGALNARIHGGVLLSLNTYLSEQGHDLVELISELGFSFGGINQWNGRYISQIDFSHLVDMLSERLSDPLLVLNWIARRVGSQSQVILLAARYAPTPMEALGVMTRFMSIAIETSKCEVHNDGSEVSIVWGLSPLLVSPDQLNDGFAAELCLFYREEFSRIGCSPLRVELTRRKPKVRGRYGHVLGAPVQFEARVNRVIFSAAAMQQPNTKADADLFDALVELCSRRLGELRHCKDFVAQVCDVILCGIETADLHLDSVARQMGMSPRVLQRRLAENGTTFQELYDSMRREVAKELLCNTNTPISEIAYRLGFSAVGNFTRAAKRWFGESPKRWRQTQGV